MSRSSSNLSVPAAITVGAVAVIALIASGVLRPAPVTGANPSPSPSAPSTPAPSEPAPTPKPTPPDPTPVPTPADDLSDGIKNVRLDIATPHEVVAEVKDFTGRVSDAKSGRAGDGMSVRWYDLEVVNLDDDTLRLTWVGLPNDDPVKVVVYDNVAGATDVRPTIVVMQLMPPDNSDAIGFDRVLDLDFDDAVLAGDYEAFLQDGWDTAG